jgi:hypothetical protein
MATAKTPQTMGLLDGVTNLQSDLVALLLRLWLFSSFAHFGHRQTPNAKLRFLVPEIVGMFQIYKPKVRFRSAIHGVVRTMSRLALKSVFLILFYVQAPVLLAMLLFIESAIER